jgi:hypothetical protein
MISSGVKRLSWIVCLEQALCAGHATSADRPKASVDKASAPNAVPGERSELLLMKEYGCGEFHAATLVAQCAPKHCGRADLLLLAR